MGRATWQLAVVCLSLLVSSVAHAHGAFPEGRQLIADPTKGQRLWLRTTYGILLSEDRGTTWSWICYEAPGYVPVEEPTFVVTGNGTLMGAVFDGLRRTKDGCAWETVSDALAKTATGLAVDPADPNHVWALLSGGDGSGGFDNQLWESTTAGDDFTLVGAPYGKEALLLSLVVAPSDPNRLYVSGLFATPPSSTLTSGVLTSKDAGKTWQRTDLDAPPGTAFFIAAVDPAQPDSVYVRFETLNTTMAETSESWVMFSSDGGQTFTEILRKKAILFAFTFTPDGSRVMAGFGDPKGAINVEQADLGLWAASPGTANFQQIHAAHIGCLSFVGAELYACTSQFQDGFELGRSTDEGATFEAVMELGHVSPLQCPAGTITGDKCQIPWVGHTCNDIGTCSLSDAGPTAATNDEDSSTGCGCRSVRPTSDASILLTVLGLFFACRRGGRARRESPA